jgi:uncharacterized membrane protein YfcA
MFSTEMIILCLAAFGAGFVDSIVGGGGLMQLPALILAFPQTALVTLLATNKVVSVTGTAFSAWRFSRQIPFIRAVIFPAMLTAFVFSTLGAYTVSILSNAFLKPVFIVLMFGVFILTIRNQRFGMVAHDPNVKIPLWKPLAVGAIIGFYDGFFGPGTGSILIIAFVGFMAMTFVQGSAYAKMINLTTNVAAISIFLWRGPVLWNTALLMMIFNVSGAILGVRLALLKGNEFIRGLLRFIVFATILKLAYEVWRDYLS